MLEKPPQTGYQMPDLRVGNPDDPFPLENYTWPELRELIYGERGGERSLAE